MHRRALTLPAFLAAALLVAACTAPRAERATTTPPPAAAAAGPDGRILVLGRNGGLFTIAPDGSGRVDVQPAGGGTSAQQPTWSPDGTSIAWIEVRDDGGIPRSAVVTARADGSGRAEAAVPEAPFFLQWDPTSSRVAYLAPNSATGIALGVVDLADPIRAHVLTGGQPLYFDWQPDGRRLFTHIGEVQLGYVNVDGGAQPIVQTGGAFRAPQWDAAGRLLYATRLDGRQTVVAVDADGAQRDVLRFDGAIAFAASPDGARLAYQAQRLPATPTPEGRPIGFAQAPAPRFAPRATTDALAVLDLATGRDARITNVPVVAFFWSPDSARLLFLTVEQAARGLAAQWYVWSDGHTSPLATFTPSLQLSRDYLPFFDQYTRAISLWSPDGTRFVYAGTGAQGADGIWVAPADGASPPVRIADGAFATWSP